jgi:hypothetical protein
MDEENGPLAISVAPETHGAVLFSDDLSTVPRLLTDNGLAEDGAVEAEAWWASWDMSDGEGALLRSEVHPMAARRLFPALGLAGVRDVLGKNGRSIAAAGAMDAFLRSETIHESLESAKDLHQQALMSLVRGEGEAALVLAFSAADALWEVSPRQVAADLIEKAERALGRDSEFGSYSKEELIRIRRLMYGASEALDDGDYPRAIRRAYYACQLLGANPP